MGEEEGSFGLNVAEKLFGFIIIFVGILMTYYTVTSIDSLGSLLGLFVFLSVLLILLGLLLLTAKTSE